MVPAERVVEVFAELEKAKGMPGLLAAADKFRLERDFERGERLRLLKLVEKQSIQLMDLQLKQHAAPSILGQMFWTVGGVALGFGVGWFSGKFL